MSMEGKKSKFIIILIVSSFDESFVAVYSNVNIYTSTTYYKFTLLDSLAHHGLMFCELCSISEQAKLRAKSKKIRTYFVKPSNYWFDYLFQCYVIF